MRWLTPDGPPKTKLLVFSTEEGDAVRRPDLNTYVWKPALAGAGVIPEPPAGQRHQAAREHGMHALRHFYASALLPVHVRCTRKPPLTCGYKTGR
jgi:hypothetical protein